MNKNRAAQTRKKLDALYRQYHDPKWIGSDPLQFVYHFESKADREIVGLIAASLAYGNVKYINVSIARVLERLENKPHDFLISSSHQKIKKSTVGFRHRWTDEIALADLLLGVKALVNEHGGLGRAFVSMDQPGRDIMATLRDWVNALRCKRPCKLLADPGGNSACKRLLLYLRWMVRKDRIDPGCWEGIAPSRLIVPLDTHMYKFAVSCGFTDRKAADFKTAMEITTAFKRIAPEDPVKYDFSLTRPGIIEGWKP